MSEFENETTEKTVETAEEPVAVTVEENAPVTVSADEVNATDTVQPETTEPKTTTTEQKSARKPSIRRAGQRKPDTSKYANTVTLVGTVAKVIEHGTVAILVLCVRNNGFTADYPSVMCYQDTKDAAVALKKDDRVRVIGEIRTYDPARLKPGQSPVLLVANEITHETVCGVVLDEAEDESLDGAALANDTNRLELRGQVTGLTCDQNGNVTIKLKTTSSGRWCELEYPYLVRNLEHFLANIHLHQFVRAYGTVQTTQVPVDANWEKKMDETHQLGNDQRKPPEFKMKKKQFYALYDIFGAKN